MPANDEPTQTARIAPARYWPVAADVEQAAAEGECDGEADEDQRRRRDQRLLQVERGDRAGVPRDLEEPDEAGAVEDRAVRVERVASRS